jgi:hypothetical protein
MDRSLSLRRRRLRSRGRGGRGTKRVGERERGRRRVRRRPLVEQGKTGRGTGSRYWSVSFLLHLERLVCSCPKHDIHEDFGVKMRRCCLDV